MVVQSIMAAGYANNSKDESNIECNSNGST